MDIKLLRAFITLARLKSYRTAAELLCISQPALTKQIKTLEFHAGVTLFLRGRHGARLTEAGEQLLAGAVEVVERYDGFRAEVADIQQGNVGTLRLGFGVSSFRLAPRLVASFRSRFPEVQVSLDDMPSAVQCRELAEGQLQAGFVRLPVSGPLSSRVMSDEKLVLAVSSQHAVTHSLEAIALLRHTPLLQLAKMRGEGLSAQVTDFLNGNSLLPLPGATANDIQTLLALVSADEGVALLPASVSHILPQGVKLVPLTGENTTWQIGIAWDPRIKDPVRDNFLATVLS